MEDLVILKILDLPTNRKINYFKQKGRFMKKTTVIPTQNPKNTSRVAQVVELGTATNLTLGGGSGGAETRNRPFGSSF